ncbi:ABC transporter permease [Flavobacterium rhizosphaerae]|uniref:ABC transporter permease n=1 Tax=Flavobacterium rhizosphaerae TaxID=3163298 RepID=A0ABW8YYX7_9FLAO
MGISIDIQNYLPHRAPMLMVNTIKKIDTQSVETVFEIKEDNIFLQDGFLVESGLVENAAQTCSAIVAQSYVLDENGNEKYDIELIGFISSIRKISIHALPPVGTTINTSASLISRFDADNYTTCMIHCRSFCGDEMYLEGEINLFIQVKQDEKERSTAG